MNTVTVTETKNTISVNETTNTVTIQEGQATVVTVATEGPQGPAFADGDIGDIIISDGGTVATIDAGAINTTKIADDAVNSDKLASGLLLSAGTNKNIRFAGNIGEIGSVTGFQAVNDAENANTDFGIRATTIRLATGSAERLRVKDAGIDVTGDITATGDLTITSATPIINLTDSNNDSDYQIKNGNGDFNIKDVTNNANRLSINSSGRVDVAGNLDVGSGLDVTGNITVTGTVDGRNLATDGTKLDGIESNATADQTASDIKTLLNSDGLTNSQISGSAAIAGTKISPDFGSQNITSTGNVSANAVSGASFSGNGASITNINAANIASGQIASARVPTLNQNTTGSAATLTTARTIAGVSFDGSANIDISYANLTNKLTVGDGGLTQNNFTDTLKTKLDGVAVGATNVTNTNQLTNGAGFITASDGITGNAASATVLATARTIAGASFDGSANIDISYTDLTNKLTVGDGGLTQNNFTNTLKTKLDGIEANAINASNTAITNKLPLAGGTLTGDLTISSATPIINLTDTNNDSDYQIKNGNGDFNIKDTTNDANRLTINSSGLVTITNDLTVTGNFTVNGTTTTIDTTTLTVEDKNIELGKVSTPTDTTADGGGITLKGATDKTFQWLDATDSWTSSEHIALPDNKKLQLGDSQDLTIFHSGSDSKIQETGTGSLYIQTDNQIILGKTGGENLAKFIADGKTELYFDNSKKLETTSNGINVYNSGLVFQTTASGTNTFGNIQIPNDTGKIRLGASQDLELYHDGSHNYITSSNGIIHIIGDGTNQIKITAKNGEQGIRLTPDGAFEAFYDNSKKIETTSTGVDITDNLSIPDDNYIYVGDGNDLRIRHDATGGNHSYIFHHGTGVFKLASDTQLILGLTSAEKFIGCNANDNVELYYDNSKKLETTSTGVNIDGNLLLGHTSSRAIANVTAAQQIEGTAVSTSLSITRNSAAAAGSSPKLNFGRTRGSAVGDNDAVADNDNLGEIRFSGADGNDLTNHAASISALVDGSVSNNTVPARLVFSTATGSDPVERLRITSDGNIQIPDSGRLQLGASQDLQIYHSGSSSYIQNSTGFLFIHGNDIALRSQANENYIVCDANAEVELYFDNSKKLETTSTGVSVTGDATISGGQLTLGAADTASGHLNSFEVMTFNIDSDNDDTNRYFAFYKNGNSGSGTELFKILEDGNVQIANDNAKLQLGASQDLQLYHDGSNSYIDETGTGGLYIRVAGTANNGFYKYASNEPLATFQPDNAVRLYYDNSKKLETTADGITVQQGINVDGIEGGAAQIRLKADQGDDNNDLYRLLVEDGGAGLKLQNYDGSFNDRLTITSTGVDVTGTLNASGQLVGNSSNSGKYVRMYGGAGTGRWDIYGHGANLRFSDNESAGSIVFDHNVDANGGIDVTGDINVTGGINPTNNITFTDSSAGGNNRIIFGASADLQIWHDGNHSYIADEGTGRLKLAGSAVQITNAAITETMLYAVEDGAVELYYDHSKKLNTHSGGITVTGYIQMDGTEGSAAAGNIYIEDNGKLKFGDGGDLEIYHDGSNSFISETGTGVLKISGGGGVFINNEDNSEFIAAFLQNGAVELFYDHSKKLETTSSGANVTGKLGINVSSPATTLALQDTDPVIHIVRNFGSGSSDIGSINFGNNNIDSDLARITAVGDGATDNAALVFKTQATGNAVTERMRINSSGNVQIANDSGKLQLGASQDLELYHDGSHSYVKDNGTGELRLAGLVRVTDGNANHTQALFTPESSVELYYNNSKKFETISWGARVTGNLDATGSVDTNELTINGTTVLNSSRSLYNLGVLELADNIEARFGSGTDLKIYHDSTNSLIDNNTGDLYINSAGGIFIAPNNDEAGVYVRPNGAVELYYDNDKKFETASIGVYSKSIMPSSHETFDIGQNMGRWNNIYIADSGKLRLGQDDDLQIYHAAGAASHINATGLLNIDGTTGVRLEYNNATKLETKSYGVLVTGYITANPTSGNLGFHAGDDTKMTFGAGDDLQIYHDGTDSIITNSTGDLKITDTSDDITITAADDIRLRPQGGENGINVLGNGGVELYYDNSQKLATFSAGISVTGQVNSDGSHMGDNDKAIFGNSNDLEIYHNGSNSFIVNGTGQLQIRSDQLGMTPNDGSEYMFFANKDGNVELYYDGSKKFESTSAGVEVSGNVTFAGDSNTHISHPQADYLKITTGGNEVMSFTDASNIFVPDSRKLMFGDNVDLQIRHDGSNSYITHSGTGNLYIDGDTDDLVLQAGDDVRIQTQGNEDAIQCLGNGGVELFYDNSKKLETTSSGVTVTGTVTETSDIALKSNIEPLNNALEKIKQITGYKYNLNSQASMGVIAQDVEKVLPELVHGFEGKKSLQYSGLIGVLVEAVKELSAKVAALEAA